MHFKQKRYGYVFVILLGMMFGWTWQAEAGFLLVSSKLNASIQPYNDTTGAFVGTFASVTDPRNLVFGPDGNLYAASGLSFIRRYNGTTGDFIDNFISVTDPQDLTFGPDGNLYVTSGQNGTVQRYNGVTGTFIDFFASVTRPRGLTFSPQQNVTPIPEPSTLFLLIIAIGGMFGYCLRRRKQPSVQKQEEIT